MTWRVIWLVMAIAGPNWYAARVLAQELAVAPDQPVVVDLDQLVREIDLHELPKGLPQPAEVEATQPPEPELSAAALEILDAYTLHAKEVRRKAEDDIKKRREILIQKLQSLQDDYTRAAKLDEAVAIRDQLRLLRTAHLKPLQSPGNLVTYGTKAGRSFFFDVVGSARGSVWGTDLYTTDSSLAAAAVHAGVLKSGQRGIVKVTIMAPPEEFVGSAKNGVTSMKYGAYPASYSVERPLPTDEADTALSDESPDTVGQPPQAPFAPVLEAIDIPFLGRRSP